MKNSYRLWSLLDMLQFYAHDFAEIVRDLAYFRILVRERRKADPLFPADVELKMTVNTVRKRCERVGLDLAAIQCGRLAQLMAKENPSMSHLESVDQAIGEVSNRILDELQASFSLSLTPEEKRLYEPTSSLFGAEVEAKFPTALYEIDEAGKCLAIGRDTAAVFHCMRIMEIGIGAIRQSLGIPDPIKGSDRNWGKMLEKIGNDLVKKNSSGWKASADRGVFESFHASLDAVRSAWRNTTMHVEKKYTQDEAAHIFAVVKGFMQVVASRMDEQGLPLA